MTFPDAFADAGKDGNALVQTHDGVHEFHDQYRLAHPGATEQAGLAAAHEGAEQIDDLDPGEQHVAGPRDFRQRYRGRHNRAHGFGNERRAAIKRPTENIQQAPEAIRGDRYLQTSAAIENRHLSLQPTGAMQGNGPHPMFIEMAMHLEGETLPVQADVNRPVQGWQAGTANIDDRPLHLLDNPQRRAIRRRATRHQFLIASRWSTCIHGQGAFANVPIRYFASSSSA